MKYIEQSFDQERALYGVKDAEIINCSFDGPADGESALKEAKNITVSDCYFNLRYPFWHVDCGKITDSEMTENCRAALWYDRNIIIDNCRLNGIKALRECEDVVLKNNIINSPEFCWKTSGISLENCELVSEYPFFEIKNAEMNMLKMKGKYSFQYTENLTISHSCLDTKDAFWHSKNVTVMDSEIKGEYLAWYSENLTLVRCKISGTQPFCYCKGLVLIDCEMQDTDLSFEKSEVDADINGSIQSVKNPISGHITADFIGEIIVEQETDCKIMIR